MQKRKFLKILATNRKKLPVELLAKVDSILGTLNSILNDLPSCLLSDGSIFLKQKIKEGIQIIFENCDHFFLKFDRKKKYKHVQNCVELSGATYEAAYKVQRQVEVLAVNDFPKSSKII